MNKRLKTNENLDLMLEIFRHTIERFDDKSEVAKSEYLNLYMILRKLFLGYVLKILAGNALKVEDSQHIVILKVLHCFFALFESSSRAKKLAVIFLSK